MVNIQRMFALEAEGAQAAVAGKSIDDNPYRKDDGDGNEWATWHYGFMIGESELNTIKENKIGFTSTADNSPTSYMTAEEAYKRGMWAPQYATVPSSWNPSVSFTSTFKSS